jgi:predicted nucleic acid-binding protein
MSARFFLDTNIFVYSFEISDPRSRLAEKLIRRAIDSGNGIISYQIVQEFFNVALRKFARPLAPFVRQEYFNTALRPLLAVHSSPALFMAALQLNTEHGFSWYDALVVAAAQEADCSILYSEDLQHGRRIGNLRIEDPFS